jgi:hypothetical protein
MGRATYGIWEIRGEGEIIWFLNDLEIVGWINLITQYTFTFFITPVRDAGQK